MLVATFGVQHWFGWANMTFGSTCRHVLGYFGFEMTPSFSKDSFVQVKPVIRLCTEIMVFGKD